MRYNPDSLPVGGAAGQDYWSLSWDDPALRQAETTGADAQRSPIELNIEAVGAAIASLQAPFVEAIEKGDGYEPYHSAEIKKLEDMRPRIEHLVRIFSVAEPVNETFVLEMVGQLDKLDYDMDLGLARPSWQRRAEMVDAALAAMEERELDLPAAA